MTTEWFLLIVLAPLLVGPIVLLFGFAGCGFSVGVGLATPTNLRATGTSTSTIDLAWDNPNTEPVTFEVDRTKEGESTPQTTIPSATTTLVDTGLQEATTYFYTVRAVEVANPAVKSSDSAPPASGRTIARAFLATLTTNDPGREGFTVVQRIEPARLLQSTLTGDILTPGARIRVTVRGSTEGQARLDRVYISQAALQGDVYDSDNDIIYITSGVDVPINTAVVLPDIDYDLDRTKPLIVAFDISSTPNRGNLRYQDVVSPNDGTAFLKPATIEASIKDRAPSVADPTGLPYNSFPRVYLIEKIEVV